MSPTHTDIPHFDTHVDVPVHVDVPTHADVPIHADVPVHVDVPVHADVPIHADLPAHVDRGGVHFDAAPPHVDLGPHIDVPPPIGDLGPLPDPADIPAAIAALANRIDASVNLLLTLATQVAQVQAAMMATQQSINMAVGAALQAANGTLPTLSGLQSSMSALFRQYGALTESLERQNDAIMSRYEPFVDELRRRAADSRQLLLQAQQRLQEQNMAQSEALTRMRG